ncbi:Z1 domain-containing protein [Neobacillus drentensis]|uniref:Z1 domain-containing protein n=1 Tax=Neobacillus drentensis TaxID=220684 RepID=UPI002FFF25FF
MYTIDVKTQGLFFKQINEKNKYSSETIQCIENTVINLLKNDTSVNRPGMLLGKIQSGKTRAFIGITAMAFDNDYDIAIVLTKGTRALAQQTYERLKKEFEDYKEDDVIQIFDIMSMPDNLIDYELDQKLIFVVKKEANNLRRLQKALFETYPNLANKKVLIIDDEADFASIGFSKTQQEIYEINVIAGLIDNIRKELNSADFLQVTATPYSLYLQPEDLKIDGSTKTFKPVKPVFTELVPVPDAYIGGEYYFEESEEDDSIASHIYEPISSNELLILKKADGRRFKLEDVLTNNKINSLRHAIINFIVGGSIRRIQDKRVGVRQKKYSFIVHTEQAKAAHEWQETIVAEMKDQLKHILDTDINLLNDLIQESYEDLIKSLSLIDSYIPSLEEIKFEVITALSKDYLMITKVNSEKDVSQLLDDTGQLKLRAPLNVFIGGQILDRGITIGNLIGFYYGRNPKTFQQDTVLQHSRMFGYRPIEDLAVTRFYTTNDIYDVMKKIHEFDSSLRIAFENGGQDKGVVFIQKDDKNKIIPCSPNKILLSKTTALKPLKRLLPVGFQTGYKSYISKAISELDQLIGKLSTNDEQPFLMDLDQAVTIIEIIKTTFAEDEGKQWDEAAFISSMEFLSNTTDSANQGKVWCIIRKDRNIGRIRMDDRYEDAPDTPKGKTSELRIAKQIATDIPALILLRQNGKEENGWRNCAFWWPVLVTPANTKTTIFTSKSIE